MCKIIIVILLLLAVSNVYSEENKCEKLDLKHAWREVKVFDGANIDGLSGLKEGRYQRCQNCGKYKLKLLVERYKYWEDKDEQDHSLSWFPVSNIPFTDVDL